MFKGICFFLKFSFQHRKSYLAARLFVEIIHIFTALVQIIMPKYVLNELFGEQRMEYLVGYLGILLGVTLFGGVLADLLQTYADNSLELLRREFECDLMQNQMQCDFSQIETPKFQDHKAKAKLYISGQWNNFGTVMEKGFSLFGYVFTLLGVVSIVMSLHIVVLLVFLVLAVFNTWIGTVLKSKKAELVKGFVPVLRRRGYYESVVKEIGFAKEIRLNGISEWLLERYNKYMALFCDKTKPVHYHDFLQKSILAVTGFLQQGVTYGYLIWLAVKAALTLGDFTMYLNAVNVFNSIINSCIDTVLELINYTSYYQDFEQFHQFYHTMRTGTRDAFEVAGEEAELCFCDVSFRYPGQQEDVLKHISVTIPFGKHISIVGENGAGKTTFIKLLTRLYDPTEGKILLNGVDIRELEYDSYMRLFSVVFQDYKLFKMSIRDNILTKQKTGQKESRMEEAIQITGLKLKLDSLKNGINTQIYRDFDAEGVELSGGESHKVAMCRAYCKDAPIYILDEPTAALDPKAECEVYENFHSFVKEHTALFISHRMASSRVCDDILVFSKGNLVEHGTHQELMKQGGLYQTFFSLQAQYFAEGV